MNRRELSPVLSEALRYARKGWYIFPAPPGTKMGYKKAERPPHLIGRNWGYTKDEADIHAYWRKYPNANVGIPTGPENGFLGLEAPATISPDFDTRLLI